jgi:hypothetical protein
MVTQYEFVVRFRDRQEPEGCGSVLCRLVSTASLLTTAIRKMHRDIMEQHPTALFDGMTLCSCEDA